MNLQNLQKAIGLLSEIEDEAFNAEVNGQKAYDEIYDVLVEVVSACKKDNTELALHIALEYLACGECGKFPCDCDLPF